MAGARFPGRVQNLINNTMAKIQETLKNTFELNKISFDKSDLAICEDIVKNCQSQEYCVTTAANLICEEMNLDKRSYRTVISNSLTQEGIIKN